MRLVQICPPPAHSALELPLPFLAWDNALPWHSETACFRGFRSWATGTWLTHSERATRRPRPPRWRRSGGRTGCSCQTAAFERCGHISRHIYPHCLRASHRLLPALGAAAYLPCHITKKWPWDVTGRHWTWHVSWHVSWHVTYTSSAFACWTCRQRYSCDGCAANTEFITALPAPCRWC